MAQAGAGAYGYGNVYRQYPQAQLAQVPPRAPLVPVGPDPIRYVPPWEVEAQHWAAIGAAALIVFFARREQEQGERGGAIAFPDIGQWQPESMDPPSAVSVWAQLGLPRRQPVTGPAVGPDAWAAALANWAAISAAMPVLSLVSPQRIPTGDRPVAFPLLGAWWPHLYDIPDATIAIRAALKVWRDQQQSGPAIVFPKLGQWMPVTQPLDESYYSFRLAQLARVPPPPLVAPWWSEAAHWPAIGALTPAVYLVSPARFATTDPAVPYPVPDPRQWWPHRYDIPDATLTTRMLLDRWLDLPVGAPPVAFPRLGQWMPTTVPLDESFYSVRQRLLAIFNPPPPVPFTPPWATALAHSAAIGASALALYLEQAGAPVLPIPVVAPPLGQWTPRPLPFDTSYFSLRQPQAPIVLSSPVVPSWVAALAHAAALGATNLAVYLEQATILAPPVTLSNLPPSWASGRDHWAALGALTSAVYLEQAARVAPIPPIAFPALGQWSPRPLPFDLSYFALRQPQLPIVPASPPLPSWVTPLAHWASIGWAGLVVYQERAGQVVLLEPPTGLPAWGTALQQWSAIAHAEPALHLARQALLLTVDPAFYIPSWAAAQAHTAALHWVNQVLYAERTGRPNSDIPRIEPPRPLWLGFYRRADDTAFLQRVVRAIFASGPPFLPRPAGLVGIVMTRLEGQAIHLPPWVAGLIEDVDPKVLQPGTISEGENFVPDRAPRLAARGGSRIMLTLHDDAGSPAELSHVCGLFSRAGTGAVALGWSSGTTKHYAYSVTSDMAFAGASEALSRAALPANWNRASVARPVIASLFERLYVCDATEIYSSRNSLIEIDAGTPPGATEQTFAFVGGTAQVMRPFCLEDYNNVLFVAGYGDEGVSASDDPALVRHSFLGQRPGSANGFDKDAYNTIGAKGERITAMKKGRGLLLVAKANELHRITGFGKAYPGWQYQVEGVDNSLGFGVENPLALEYAEGLWFGIGKQGPFMTDGFEVTTIVGPRQRTWRGIDKLDKAFVRYHPERGLILFGVHIVSGAPDTTYPWVKLAWDIQRRVWQPNWRLTGNTRFFVMQAVATSAVQGPSAPPTGPNTTVVTFSSWRANWTNGDATAETEYWEREDTGASVLSALIGPGTALYNASSRNGHQTYGWKVRHRKGGVYTDFTTEQVVQTDLAAPTVSHVCELVNTGFGGGMMLTHVNVANPNKGSVTITLEKFITGVWTVVKTWTGQPQGTVTYNAVGAPANGDYRARCTDAVWPNPNSAYSGTHTTACG